MAGVLFVICVPTENYENSVKKPKKEIIIGDFDTEKLTEGSEQSILSKQHFSLNSSQEKLIPMSEDSSISDISRKKSPISKSKSVDLLNTSSPKKGMRQNKSWDCNEILNSSAVSHKCEEKPIYDDGNMPLEKVLRMILEEQKIKNAVWTKGESGNYLQVIFPLESGNQCEGTLAVLNQYGIGQRLNSVVSVIPCSLYYKDEEDSDKFGLNEEELEKKIKREHAKNTAWNRFVSSVRARLTVAQVVEGVKANAALTFDFLILLLIASILSAIALAENNNVYLVSSMLISPMMGPVMAGTFGRVIQDKKLQKIGVLNELLGVGLATAVGFCYGVIITSLTDRYGDGDWPTYEMTSRGETRTLWVGCLIALLSGAAVALGMLGDNIASLVGVAISASLMPPAVNAGLMWAMAVVYAFAGENSSKSIVRTHFYSSDDVWELAALGGVSMCLTFGNIVCIYLAGILVFKIKEVAPLSSKDHSRRFWKYDIKIARDYNRTLQDEDAKIITKHLSSELTGYNDNKYESLMSADEKRKRDQLQEFADNLCQSTELVREHIVNINKMQNTWSPSTFSPRRPTIQELKNVYFSMVDDKPKVQRSLNFRFPVSKSLQPTSWANPGTSQQSIQNDGNTLPCIPENTKNDSLYKGQTSQQVPSSQLSSKLFTGTKKFVVTPASIDDLR